MDINDVFNILKYRASKGGYSGYISPDDFNLLFNKAQIRYFNKLYLTYASTQRISDSLSKFVQPLASVTLTGGVWTLPNDLIHITSVLYNQNPVIRVEADRLGNHLTSTYDAPSAQYPIYVQYATTAQVYPTSLTSVQVTYLAKPQDVNWAYTINNSNPNLPRTIYNQGASTQPKWSDVDLDAIVYLMLEDVGINLRDGELEQFAQVQEKTNSN